ncbi:EamA family transporter, partial [Klebsiella pneumoniae]
MKQERSIALPLAISIIAISFAAVFVKMSSAPSSILGMYRLWIIVLIMLPIVWNKRDEFSKIQIKDWGFLIGSGFFLAIHFRLWFE